MQLQSLAFKSGKEMPSLYTCDGNKINPPLEFLDVPSGICQAEYEYQSLGPLGSF